MSFKTDGYLLGRNMAATTRLNYMHFLWIKTLGFQLHPIIPAPKEDARIVDVGTGSGIWLLDLATKLPSTTYLLGLDINLAQCPMKERHPANVHFHQRDFFDDVPTYWEGTFDVVHARLIANAVKNGDPVRLVDNLAGLVKAGGYLQWEELDLFSARVETAEPRFDTPALEAVVRLFKSPIKGSSDTPYLGDLRWIEKIPTILESHGFQKVRKEEHVEDAWMTPYWTALWVATVEEMAKVADAAGDVEMEAKLSRMVPEALREIEEGTVLVCTKMVHIAQRRSRD